jgi:predicted dehydrogenase
MAYVLKNYPTIKTTQNWQDIIDDPEVDAVIIATPASSHYELAKAALNAGKHILVEKPLAMNVREADELIAIAAATNNILMAGHTFLYNPAVRYMKELITKQELGQIYYIYGQRVNLGQVRSDVNAWWNLAPHDISILLYLLEGELPTSIAAHGTAYLQPDIEDVVFATMTWANQVTANIQVSWLDPGKIRKMTLVGSRKMIVYDDISDSKITILDKGVEWIPKAGEVMDFDRLDNYNPSYRSGDIWLPKIDNKEPLGIEANHFLECIRKGEVPISDGKHARDVVAVLEAGQIALKSGQKVSL